MKLSSVVLLSVNLVAASQVAANAADTASFLQDALTPSAASAKAASRPAARPVAKKRASKTSYVAMTPVMDGVKCRPFMPGRYLPSESELEARKEAERARREADAAQRAMSFAPDVLTGRVAATNDMSNMGAMMAPAASYSMSRPANQDYMHKVQGIVQKVKEAAKGYSLAHTRSVPGMNPVMPGQFAHNSGATAMPRIPEPQRATMPLNVPQPPVARSMPVQVPQAPQHVAASTPVVPLPSLSKWDNAQLDKLIDNNMPENVYANVNGDMRAGQGNPGVSGAGPTPYPLNSSINRRGVQTIGAQARFGSWHGGHENLPQSSFQSYMPVHMAGPMSVKINHYSGGSKKTGRQAARIAGKHHASSASTAAASVVKVDKVKSVPAASYPPYRRYGSMF